MQYQIKFTKYAMKEFLQLPKHIRDIFVKKLNLLAVVPFAINNNVKKSHGIENCYRLRVGNYRVIYRIIKLELVIEIIKVGHRKEVYL